MYSPETAAASKIRATMPRAIDVAAMFGVFNVYPLSLNTNIEITDFTGDIDLRKSYRFRRGFIVLIIVLRLSALSSSAWFICTTGRFITSDQEVQNASHTPRHPRSRTQQRQEAPAL